MIKLERTSVMNFENALRGMRNPMNSWDKSDSFFCDDLTDYDKCVNCRYLVSECECNRPECGYIIGNNDLELAQRLAKSGSDHRKFLRQIFVSVDVTAPLYWWKEYETYKVGTVSNSCSTMHTIHKKAFTLDDFSCEKLSVIDIGGGVGSPRLMMKNSVRMLNECRELYLKTQDKEYWYQMIQLLPTSYNQMRTCTLNYENLINIYFARRYHKLPEWHEFCGWIEGLPYFKEICIEAMPI
jgi:hypothetical protein